MDDGGGRPGRCHRKSITKLVCGVCYASVPPRASLWRRYRPTVDQEVGIWAYSLQNEPKSTHKNERASIPLEGYPDVVSAISAIRTKWKGSSQASQSGWSMPPIFDGGTRQLTLLANAPNSEDHKTTFVRSSPRRRRRSKQS